MAWPAIIESFFVAFAGLVDSFMVSRLGSYAVAAVGLTTQPKFVGLAMFFAVNVSISALVARRYGEKDKKDANRVFVTAMRFVIIASIILSVIFVVGADPIIELCGATQDGEKEIATHEAAVAYFRIIMGGMIFNCVQMAINSAQRGSGNTKITMRTNVTSNAVNIVLNYLLIEGHCGFPAWGIKGAAIATVISQVLAFSWQCYQLSDQSELIHLKKGTYRLRGDLVKNMLTIGLSPCLMNAAACFVVLLINRGLQNQKEVSKVGARVRAIGDF